MTLPHCKPFLQSSKVGSCLQPLLPYGYHDFPISHVADGNHGRLPQRTPRPERRLRRTNARGCQALRSVLRAPLLPYRPHAGISACLDALVVGVEGASDGEQETGGGAHNLASSGRRRTLSTAPSRTENPGASTPAGGMDAWRRRKNPPGHLRAKGRMERRTSQAGLEDGFFAVLGHWGSSGDHLESRASARRPDCSHALRPSREHQGAARGPNLQAPRADGCGDSREPSKRAEAAVSVPIRQADGLASLETHFALGRSALRPQADVPLFSTERGISCGFGKRYRVCRSSSRSRRRGSETVVHLADHLPAAQSGRCAAQTQTDVAHLQSAELGGDDAHAGKRDADGEGLASQSLKLTTSKIGSPNSAIYTPGGRLTRRRVGPLLPPGVLIFLSPYWSLTHDKRLSLADQECAAGPEAWVMPVNKTKYRVMVGGGFDSLRGRFQARWPPRPAQQPEFLPLWHRIGPGLLCVFTSSRHGRACTEVGQGADRQVGL